MDSCEEGGMACVKMTLFLKTNCNPNQMEGICFSDSHLKWAGKRWRMSIDTVFNLFVLPEDSADCRAGTWQEKQWSWWSISSKDLLFALLSPTIIVPHFGWSILAKLWERLPSQNQSFPHYFPHYYNYGRPSDVSQLIRIIVFKHICCLCFFTTKATSQLYP